MWGITSDENHDLYVGSWSHKVRGKLTLDWDRFSSGGVSSW